MGGSKVSGAPLQMTESAPSAVFHLAFPVDDLAIARAFYLGVLGCSEGRSSATWVDFDFFGHQISAHLRLGGATRAATNTVESKEIPVPHFGLVLGYSEWQRLVDRLRELNVQFLIEPFIRFPGKTGEQASFFIQDPSGNALEFKAFHDSDMLFAR